MRVTIDRAGRIVVPKAVRDRHGLAAGTELELDDRDGVLELHPPASKVHLEDRNGRLVAVADEELAPMTAEGVREILEAVRDRR